MFWKWIPKEWPGIEDKTAEIKDYISVQCDAMTFIIVLKTPPNFKHLYFVQYCMENLMLYIKI